MIKMNTINDVYLSIRHLNAIASNLRFYEHFNIFDIGFYPHLFKNLKI